MDYIDHNKLKVVIGNSSAIACPAYFTIIIIIYL